MNEVVEFQEAAISLLKNEMLEWTPVKCPLVHLFTPGMYVRKIVMPARTRNENGKWVDTVVISKEHRTTHPFYVTKGHVGVFNTQESLIKYIKAPYLGVTIPNTRRVLRIYKDCHWTTFHPLPFITGAENELPEDEKAELIKMIELYLVGETVEWPS